MESAGTPLHRLLRGARAGSLRMVMAGEQSTPPGTAAAREATGYPTEDGQLLRRGWSSQVWPVLPIQSALGHCQPAQVAALAQPMGHSRKVGP